MACQNSAQSGNDDRMEGVSQIDTSDVATYLPVSLRQIRRGLLRIMND